MTGALRVSGLVGQHDASNDSLGLRIQPIEIEPAGEQSSAVITSVPDYCRLTRCHDLVEQSPNCASRGVEDGERGTLRAWEAKTYRAGVTNRVGHGGPQGEGRGNRPGGYAHTRRRLSQCRRASVSVNVHPH